MPWAPAGRVWTAVLKKGGRVPRGAPRCPERGRAGRRRLHGTASAAQAPPGAHAESNADGRAAGPREPRGATPSDLALHSSAGSGRGGGPCAHRKQRDTGSGPRRGPWGAGAEGSASSQGDEGVLRPTRAVGGLTCEHTENPTEPSTREGRTVPGVNYISKTDF